MLFKLATPSGRPSIFQLIRLVLGSTVGKLSSCERPTKVYSAQRRTSPPFRTSSSFRCNLHNKIFAYELTPISGRAGKICQWWREMSCDSVFSRCFCHNLQRPPFAEHLTGQIRERRSAEENHKGGRSESPKLLNLCWQMSRRIASVMLSFVFEGA